MFKNFQSKAAYKIINLQNMIINATEQELKVLAGTNNKTGTSMYGLAQAAQSKGLSAAGIEVSVDDLKPNHIVHVVIDGTPHFSVVREITETSVKLSDPKLGNIEMTREKFSEIFTGHALAISNPNNLTQVNGTNQLNQSTEDTDSGELEILASEDMQVIRGQAVKEIAAIAAAGAVGGVFAVFTRHSPAPVDMGRSQKCSDWWRKVESKDSWII